MPDRFTSSLIDHADIVTSTVVDGDVRFNLGDATKGTGVDADSPFFGIDGFVSMPNDADGDGAADCFYVIEGNQKIALGTRDRRYLTRLGALKPGDRFMYSKGAARHGIKNADDLAFLYTERQSDGMSMLASLNGKTGEIILSVGLTRVQIEEKRIELSINGGPAILIDGTGLTSLISLRADRIQINGGLVTLGVNTDGTPPTIPGVQSVLIGPAGQVGVPSPKVLAAQY